MEDFDETSVAARVISKGFMCKTWEWNVEVCT